MTHASLNLNSVLTKRLLKRGVGEDFIQQNIIGYMWHKIKAILLPNH